MGVNKKQQDKSHGVIETEKEKGKGNEGEKGVGGHFDEGRERKHRRKDSPKSPKNCSNHAELEDLKSGVSEKDKDSDHEKDPEPGHLEPLFFGIGAPSGDRLIIRERDESDTSDTVVTQVGGLSLHGGHQVTLDSGTIRCDNYEKDPENVVVVIYVKDICDERVDYEENSFTVHFRTKDDKFKAQFLEESEHVMDEDTTFVTKIDLKHGIKPEHCTHKKSKASLQIYLRKKNNEKWTQVLASNLKKTLNDTNSTRNNHPSSPVTNGWVPAVPGDSKSSQVSGDDGSALSRAPPPPPPPPPTELAKENTKMGLWSKWSSGASSAPPVIGYTGLDNLGNTCFMNSVIQCLSNTEELRDYFLSNHFMEDLNKENPLGTGGNLAMSFAVLLCHLWSGQHHSYSAAKLKCLMGEKVSRFSGFAQHDAQEYMAYLLDAVHEDVNRVKIKPYIDMNSAETEEPPPDEIVADDSWKKYRMRNDSVIVDLFQGQFKSKLVCPECKKVSITFDPFLYLSVPLPKNSLLHTVYFFYRDTTKKPIRHVVNMRPEAKARQLLEVISGRTGVPLKQLRAIITSNGTISKFLQPNYAIPSMSNQEMLLIFELLSSEEVGEDVCEFAIHQRLSMPVQSKSCTQCKQVPVEGVKLKKCTKCFRASYCNQECQKNNWSEHKSYCSYKPEPVGCPFLVTLPQSQCTLSNLSQVVTQYSRYSVDIHRNSRSSSSSSENGTDPEVSAPPKKKFCLKRFTGGFSSSSQEEGTPLVDPSDPEECDKPLADLKNQYYLAMDWLNSDRFKERIIVETKELDHSYNILEAEKVHRQWEEFSLEDCLRLFTDSESLSPQEAWFCPRCKEHREASKELTLWRLPPLLIIQLKRFSFKNFVFREKIDKMIRFPVHGLDLTDYSCPNSSHQTGKQKPIYDLYGVINHYGGMFGGHYVSAARTSFKQQHLGWRLFDDSRVEDVSEEDVVTKSAYILFYRLREDDSESKE